MKGELKYSIVAIIPARGRSKEIKRKNIRFVHGKPLLYYPISMASKSKYISEIYVSSDDADILGIAKIFGAKTIKRPPELAEDTTPLDPVIFHAINFIEEKTQVRYDVVVTLQPTVPLIASNDLDKAIEMLINENYDTVIFACEATHIYWVEHNGWRPFPNVRANRQYLPKIVKELGVTVTWREWVKPNKRFGHKIGVYIVPEEKGIDVNTYQDLMMVETLLKKYRILFIVDGKRETGLGHIYRCLTLAEKLHGHNLLFLTNGKLGKTILSDWGCNVRILNSEEEFLRFIATFNPNLVINDILDTTKEYMELLQKNTNGLIVNFEDLGEGANYADLLFNDLYEHSSPPSKHYYGYRYFILRDEFRLFPIKRYSSNFGVKTITLLFGGVDLNNLTMKTLQALEKMGQTDLTINVIVGPGYTFQEKLNAYIEELTSNRFKIKLYASPNFIADIIYSSDLAITSNGRSLYEIVSYAIPVISIAQNERELKHPLVYLSKGVNYLGLANNISEDSIANAIKSFIANNELLIKSNLLLMPYATEIRKGLGRVLRITLGEVEDRDTS